MSTIIKVCSFAALGAVFFGMDQANWSSASSKIEFLELFCFDGGYDTLQNCRSGDATVQSAEWADAFGWMNATLYLGAMMSSLFVAPTVADRLGRKICIWAGVLFGAAGTIVLVLSRAYAPFLAGRVVLGMGVGLISYALTMYLSEVAPKETRGSMTSLFQIMVMVGLVVAALIGLPQQWPWWGNFIAPMIPAVILAVGLLFLPESPRWLITKDRHADALKVLTYLRQDDPGTTALTVQLELEEIEQMAREESAAASESSWSDLTKHGNWQRVVAACGLQVLQQFTGINAIVTFGSLFAKTAGLTGDREIYFTLLCDVSGLLGTIIIVRTIDNFGRRSLLFLSTSVMFTSITACGIIGYSFAAPYSNTVGWGVVVCVMLFQFGFGLGWGAIAWVYPSEIFNLRTKGKGMSLSSGTQWLSNFLVSKFIAQIIHAIGITNVCFMFSGFCILAFLFVFVWVPETKGLALEDMDALFEGGMEAVQAKVHGKVELGLGGDGTHSLSLVKRDSLNMKQNI